MKTVSKFLLMMAFTTVWYSCESPNVETLPNDKEETPSTDISQDGGELHLIDLIPKIDFTDYQGPESIREILSPEEQVYFDEFIQSLESENNAAMRGNDPIASGLDTDLQSLDLEPNVYSYLEDIGSVVEDEEDVDVGIISGRLERIKSDVSADESLSEASKNMLEAAIDETIMSLPLIIQLAEEVEMSYAAPNGRWFKRLFRRVKSAITSGAKGFVKGFVKTGNKKGGIWGAIKGLAGNIYRQIRHNACSTLFRCGGGCQHCHTGECLPECP